MPAGQPRGLIVFIHGGYWMETDPSFWSHLAKGGRDAGWAVAIPAYPLAPSARISEMVAHLATAISDLATRVSGPILLTGHSAGGQLAARMIAADSPLSDEILDRVMGCHAVSGLFDLRPLRRTGMAGPLQLTASEASRESPILNELRRDIPISLWVGGDERPAFLAQSRAYAEMLQAAGRPVDLVIEKDRHHFDILDGYASAGTPLMQALLGLGS